MSEENTAEVVEEKKADAEVTETNETDETDVSTDSKDLEAELAKTRSEAKERRLKIKELQEKLSVFEKEKEAERQKELKAKGKHEELISELQKKLNDYEPLATKFMEYEKTKREVIKKNLEEKDLWTESFTKLDLAELETLSEKLIKKAPAVNTTDTSSKFVKTNGKDEREPHEKLAGIYKN